MTSHFRRICGDALASVAVLATVLGVLISVDPRVREQFETTAISQTPRLNAGVHTQIEEIGYVIFDVARTQSIDHAPLMIFVVCTTVLVLFMWRT